MSLPPGLTLVLLIVLLLLAIAIWQAWDTLVLLWQGAAGLDVEVGA